MIYFGSDNNAGAHPRILEAIKEADSGSFSSYGEDAYTVKAEKAFQKIFGPQAGVFFVSTGTAANIIGLKSLLNRPDGVICAQSAHISTDECGAPEANIGCKLYHLPQRDGKIDPQDCLPLLPLREAVHHAWPRVLSISQSTELGTLYSLEELKHIGAFCKQHDLFLHMDGARICNAAAAMGLSPAAISTEIGVDVLSFGGTKNGLLFGEAIITLNPECKRKIPYLRKQGMQLLSKMRYLSAQLVAYLEDDLWQANALHANKMAALLRKGLEGLEQVKITRPTQVNAVFARLPRHIIEKLRENFYFYTWDEQDDPAFLQDAPEVRLMTAFNTRQEDVERLVEATRALARG